jgi:two-component system sensor histidine kinase AgrC
VKFDFPLIKESLTIQPDTSPLFHPTMPPTYHKSVRHLLERSVKSCLLFGAMPAFFYLFDYTTTVYTGFMYSGSRAAVQFIPFVASAFYFVFVLFYYAETQKQARIQRERDILDMQFRQAQTELASLRQMQQ